MAFIANTYSKGKQELLWQSVVYGETSWPTWSIWIIPGTIND